MSHHRHHHHHENRGVEINNNGHTHTETPKKRYGVNEFLKDVRSPERNNVKATVKGVTMGLKVFVKESPHPITGFIKETMKEIFE